MPEYTEEAEKKLQECATEISTALAQGSALTAAVEGAERILVRHVERARQFILVKPKKNRWTVWAQSFGPTFFGGSIGDAINTIPETGSVRIITAIIGLVGIGLSVYGIMAETKGS